MITLTIIEASACLETEVYGAYDLNRTREIVDALKGLAARHGRFSILELHHAPPQNLMKFFASFSRDGRQAEGAADMEKLYKYALVSDEPGLLMRVIAGALNSSKERKARIFAKHDLEAARAWIAERP